MISQAQDRIPVLDKVRKLLNLSRDSANEHEAALAAQRAAALMARHEIHEAELRALDEAAHVRTPEAMDVATATPNSSKRTAWHCYLAHGVSKKLHCHYYTSRGAIIFFGRLSAIQGASYLLQYLIREGEKLCKRAAPKAAGRPWHNAFKMGYASRVSQRLAVPATDFAVATTAVDDEDAALAVAQAAEPPSPSAGALVLIKKDREEVHAAWEKKSEKWRTCRPIGAVSNAGAYADGKRAGDRANLGGSARGGLPAGQGVLRK